MLTKFPVTTDRGEYLVKVDDRKPGILGGKLWTVRLFVLRDRPILFNRYKRVFTHSTVPLEYHYYAERLNELVMEAVDKYEDHSSESFHRYINREASLMDIEEWEGDLTTKEESR